MVSIHRDSGLDIKFPESYQISEIGDPEPTRRRPPRTSGPIPLLTDSIARNTLIAALESQGMQLFDKIELTPKPESTGSGQRRSSVPQTDSPQAVEFELDLDPQENAVLLLEQDGVYSWKFATQTESIPVADVRRTTRTATSSKRIVFKTEITPTDRPDTRRGVITDFIYDKIVAVVLKFTAPIVLGQTMKYLERNLSKGIINIDSLDPQAWQSVENLSALDLPSDRPARILLFIHGTFTNTVGNFAIFTATPWGQKLLQGAFASYDAVIGFDHATLSEDPLENAIDLLQRLESFDWQYPPHIDVVAYSRGGLVFRSLVEHLIPRSNWRPYFDRTIFVAATNSGTELANPDNWHTAIDLYTNLTVAACKVVGMMPQAKSASLVVSETIKGLGAFIKYCTAHAVTDGGVPGLAAMAPDGEFVRKINEVQPGQPTIDKSYYCAITSEFESRIGDGEHEPKELPLRLVQWLADKFVDGLMQGKPNDLVVNTASMTNIDRQLGTFIKDSLDFGKNPQVYHTNYFTRPEVINALTQWLHLSVPPANIAPEVTVVEKGLNRDTGKKGISPISPRRGSGSRGTTIGIPIPPSSGETGGRIVGGSRTHTEVEEVATQASKARKIEPGLSNLAEIGSVVGSELPVAVNTDIFVTTGDRSVGEVLPQLERSPSYVVVRREHGGATLNYAFAPAEIISKTKQISQDIPLGLALGLRERDAAPSFSSLNARKLSETNKSTRSVLLENDRPIGVLPAQTQLLTASELAEMARVVENPQTAEDRTLAQQVMPSFAQEKSTAKNASKSRTTRRADLPKVICHLHADMEEEVLVNHATTVEVTISREVMQKLTGITAQGGEANLDAQKQIMISVIPKVNFELISKDIVKIDPPTPGVPQVMRFDLRATHLGSGEVWVVVSQGQTPLLTLKLNPQIVETRGTRERKLVANASTTEVSGSTEPLHTLRIFESRNGEDISYKYELYSPALDLCEHYESKPITADRREYVESLYQEIEDYWLSNQDDVKNFTAQLRARGGQLFDQLFPRELQEQLWQHRKDIDSILVLSEEPFIPWEMVHLKQPGKPLPKETIFLGQMGMVRWLYEAGFPPEQIEIRKNKSHYVIPHYPHPDFKLPEAEQEAKFLEQKFQAKPIVPQPDRVRDFLSKGNSFDLLHFACHGNAESNNIASAQLELEGRIEQEKYIPVYLTATDVEQHSNLKGTSNRRPLVVLNACQVGRTGNNLTGVGGFAQAFLKGGAGAFIGTLWSVGDSPARTFTETLYSGLIDGSNLAQAAIQAREAARKNGDATWLAYVVYGHPHMKITI
jgi:CHAT domain/Ternary complex associated domain 7